MTKTTLVVVELPEELGVEREGVEGCPPEEKEEGEAGGIDVVAAGIDVAAGGIVGDGG